MNKISKSHSIFYLLLFLIVLASIEVLCFAFYKFNPGSIFDWHFYDQAFDSTSRPTHSYGWSSPEPLPRPATFNGPDCAVAFGDSFTYGEEIQIHETWEDQASFLLNCKISNYGVGGFGTDQAYLLYQDIKPQSPLVFIGLYPEMMKRNQAASWIFYGSQKDRPLKPYFYIENNSINLVTLPATNSIKEIKNYHRHDAFFHAYDVKFPYSYHIFNAVLIRARQILAKRIPLLKDPTSIQLQTKIINKFKAAIEENQSKYAFVIFPSHIEIINGKFDSLNEMLQSGALTVNDCIIDPGPELHRALMQDKKIFAQMGHLSQLGNFIVANEVVKGIKSCRLLH